MHKVSQHLGSVGHEKVPTDSDTRSIGFAVHTIGSSEHLLLSKLDRLDDAIQEGRIEAVKSLCRDIDYLVSQQAGSPKSVLIGYVVEGDEPRPFNQQLVTV